MWLSPTTTVGRLIAILTSSRGATRFYATPRSSPEQHNHPYGVRCPGPRQERDSTAPTVARSNSSIPLMLFVVFSIPAFIQRLVPGQDRLPTLAPEPARLASVASGLAASAHLLDHGVPGRTWANRGAHIPALVSTEWGTLSRGLAGIGRGFRIECFRISSGHGTNRNMMILNTLWHFGLAQMSFIHRARNILLCRIQEK